ncbi:MAG: NAD(+) synthase [Clostridia bacterium]|nr:NAD(+) synthase [Clostridia bacterium]
MKDGFIKVKAVSPSIEVGNVAFNKSEIIKEIKKAEGEGVKILVLPELSLTGVTIGDMSNNSVILSACEKELSNIKFATKDSDVLVFVGAPLSYSGTVYSCAIAIKSGEILGVVPKIGKMPFLKDYITLNGEKYPLGTDILFSASNMPNLTIGVVVGDAVSTPSPKGFFLSELGATVIVNPSSSFELVTSDEMRRASFTSKSYATASAYIVSNPSETESTSKNIYSSHNLIVENGEILAESKPFQSKTGDCVSEIDVNYLASKRLSKYESNPALTSVNFKLELTKTSLTRKVSSHPFFPKGKEELANRCEKILTMQSRSLAKRLTASYSSGMVLGISGGLDSTLALLVCVKCADYLGWDRNKITAITMPCFGTTNRTKSNATELCKALGVALKEIDIFEATRVHFKDIGHDEENHNVVYENAQARERTQILMDVANSLGALVVGTGDLSEVALGWSTYNGDHMSMYNVNSALPKTLIRHVVAHFAQNTEENVKNILLDILDTPVSPELLPAKENGEIEQKTEDIVGPYELHDFFIYNFVGKKFAPSKIYRLALYAFDGKYSEKTIYKWLTVFIKRFFTQQFKRACSPDGVRIGSVSLSKSDFDMVSDFSYKAFLEELDSSLPCAKGGGPLVVEGLK